MLCTPCMRPHISIAQALGPKQAAPFHGNNPGNVVLLSFITPHLMLQPCRRLNFGASSSSCKRYVTNRLTHKVHPHRMKPARVSPGEQSWERCRSTAGTGSPAATHGNSRQALARGQAAARACAAAAWLRPAPPAPQSPRGTGLTPCAAPPISPAAVPHPPVISICVHREMCTRGAPSACRDHWTDHSE